MRKIHLHFKRSLISMAVSLSFAIPSHAAIVRSDVDYQLYRDFAENKGQFGLKATTVSIFDNNGKRIGTMVNGLPMIDLSVAERTNGVAVAIAPQYLTSVAHNSGYSQVEFGNAGPNPEAHHFAYQLVDRNNYPDNKELHKDYHIPRVHKLITEIVPIATTTAGLDAKTYLDRKRFPAFVRVGSGVQKTRNEKGENRDVYGAYQYLIGGTSLKVYGNRKGWIDAQSSLYEDIYGPLTTYGTAGDSGSSLFAYDAKEKRWVQLGVLNFFTGYDSNRNIFSIARPDFIKAKQEEDNGISLTNSENQGTFEWRVNGKLGMIDPPVGRTMVLDLADPALKSQDTDSAKPSLNNGKNLSIAGRDSHLVLFNDVNQGAGSLRFDANVTVRANGDHSWQGAGIIVEKGKQVTWQIKNPQGDRLSKIGTGTLLVNGTGENLGDISVGDGTVILSQQADSQGRKQAFNQLGIVSGRPTVRLMDDKQIDPNKLYFGFRGGKLDLNGNSIWANHIQNVDDGANIVNNNAQKTSYLRITGKPVATEQNLTWGEWGVAGKDIYEYRNQHKGLRTDYFVQKAGGRANSYYPIEGVSDDNWEFLSHDKATAVREVIRRKNSQPHYHSFNGFFGEKGSAHNGAMNVVYIANNPSNIFSITGGSNLNGEFTTNKGTVVFSGIPTPHAYDVVNNQEVVRDNDWINRSFRANAFATNYDAKAFFGRNISEVHGTLITRNQSQMTVGFEQGKTPNCRYSDYFGTTHCDTQAVLSEQIFANLPTTQIYGNAIVAHQSTLNLGKATLHGSIQADPQATVNLGQYATWQNNAQSRIGHLNLADSSQVNVNANFAQGTTNQYNKLILQGNLSGNGRFNLLTNAAESKGDHIEVQGVASGNFVLAVKNTGKEPSSESPLSLLTLKNSNQNQHTVNVKLANNYVDLGAYRYILANRNHDYRLYSPLKDARNHTDPSKLNTPALTQANTTLKQEQQKIDRLNEQLKTAQAAQQKVQAEIDAANQKLTQANNELNYLLQTLKKSRRPHQALFISINQARQNVARTKHQLSKITKQSSGAINELKKVETALAKANEVAREANKVIEQETTSILREQAKKLCATDKSSQFICEQSLYLSSAEGLDDIEQKDWVSQTANTVLSELSAQANALLQVEQALDQQVQNANTRLVWANQGVAKTRYGSKNYRSYRQNGALTQIGVEVPLNEDIAIGTVLSKHTSNNTFDEGINGKATVKMASLFAKWQNDSGLFGSLSSNVAKGKNQLGETHFNRRIFSLGANVGYRLNFDGLEVQPSIGAKYYRLSQAQYELDGAEIDTPKLDFIAYQAGVKVAKTFGEQWKITPSASAYYVDASHKKLAVNVNDIAFEQRFGRSLRAETGLALHKGNWQIDTNLGFAKGNELEKQTFANIKVGYRW